MAIFTTLVNIDADLRDLLKEIERYFSISLDTERIEVIFKDAIDNQVSKKEYLIFQDENRLLVRQMIISGTVDEYEPEGIWIKIKNINEKDVKHFNKLVSR